MPPQYVYSTKSLAKFYNNKPVFQDINLSFYHGAKIGIVGVNGAGKSSLLRIMAGADQDFMGEAVLSKGMRVAYVPQEPRLDLTKTVRGNLEDSLEAVQSLVRRYDEIAVKLGSSAGAEKEALLTEMGDLQDKIDHADAWEVDRMLDLASDALVLPPDDSDVSKLSGGERRRVALCKALLEKPDLLLLDEPTNHLDAETVAWLETTLKDYFGTVIIVTHDRYFLDNITKWILELDGGRGIPFEGNYSSWLQQKSNMLRNIEKKESQRQRFLNRELEWIHSSPEGRRKKSKARFARYEEMSSKSFDVNKDEVTIQIPPGPRLGDKVLAFESASKGFDGVTLLKNCTFDLPKGAIVGVVGPNGCGKTTMFRMILGEEKPDQGKVVIGSTVSLSYVDQHRDALVDAKSVYEEVSGGHDEIDLGGRKINTRAYLAKFNFRGATQQKLVGQLSGGERNRLHLAKLLKTGGNLLLLDEPTNDLDVDTMRVLEEAVGDFPGCAMVISHDRFFLDRVCTHLLVFEGDGVVRWFEGGFHDYEEKILGGGDHTAGRRSKYKRLALR